MLLLIDERYIVDSRYMAEWITYSPATLEVTGSRSAFGGVPERIDTRSLAHGDVTWSVWHCNILLRPVYSVNGDNW